MDTRLKGDIAEQATMIRAPYLPSDFDFAIAYIDLLDIFYLFPASVFISYGSEIHLVETEKRQRQPRSAAYRQRWDLIQQASAQVNELSG